MGSEKMAEENEQVYGVDIYLHKIRGWVTSRGFTPHGLAKAASFGPGTFADMYTPKWNPRVKTLRELEDFMLRYDIRMSRGSK